MIDRRARRVAGAVLSPVLRNERAVVKDVNDIQARIGPGNVLLPSVQVTTDQPVAVSAKRQIARKLRMELTVLAVARTEGVATTQRVELILSDYALPKGHGVQFIKEIRSRSGKVPIVLLTNYAMPHMHQEALAAGANETASKAMGIEILGEMLEKYGV